MSCNDGLGTLVKRNIARAAGLAASRHKAASYVSVRASSTCRGDKHDVITVRLCTWRPLDRNALWLRRDDGSWVGLAHERTRGRGEVEAVRALVRANLGVDAPDVNGWTPLHWACEQASSADMVGVLLDGGVDKDSTAESDGFAAIHRAAQRVHLPIMNILLRKGALVTTANPLNGQTALHTLVRATKSMSMDVSASVFGDAATMLLRAGASLTVPTTHLSV